MMQSRNSGQNSPAHQHSTSPRLNGTSQSLVGVLQYADAQKMFAEGTKGDLQSDAAFSDPENEAKRRIIFTISPNTGHVKQSPSNKHSPLPTSARLDCGQAHAQDGKKRGRRKRSSTGNLSGNSGVSPKRKSLPTVSGLFTQPSGSPLNINSMVRAKMKSSGKREGRGKALWIRNKVQLSYSSAHSGAVGVPVARAGVKTLCENGPSERREGCRKVGELFQCR